MAYHVFAKIEDVLSSMRRAIQRFPGDLHGALVERLDLDAVGRHARVVEDVLDELLADELVEEPREESAIFGGELVHDAVLALRPPSREPRLAGGERPARGHRQG